MQKEKRSGNKQRKPRSSKKPAQNIRNAGWKSKKEELILSPTGLKNVRLEYILDSTLTTSAGGTTAADYMTVNSAFEPYSTNKVPGFSQYTSRTGAYTVWSGEISAVVTPSTTPIAGTSGEPGAQLHLLLLDTALGIAQGGNDHSVNPTATAMLVPHNMKRTTRIGNPGTNVATVKMPFTSTRVWGLPRSDPGYRAANNALPVNAVIAVLGVETISAVPATIQTFDVEWTLIMICDFSEQSYGLIAETDPFAVNRAIVNGSLLQDLPLNPCGSCKYLATHPYVLCSCQTQAPCMHCFCTVPCTEGKRLNCSSHRCPLLKLDRDLAVLKMPVSPMVKRDSLGILRPCPSVKN